MKGNKLNRPFVDQQEKQNRLVSEKRGLEAIICMIDIWLHLLSNDIQELE